MVHIARVRAASNGWPGQPGLNTFYFTGQAAGELEDVNSGDAQLCVDRVRAAFFAGKLLWPSIWSVVVSPDVDVLDDATGELVDSFSVTPPASVAGTNGAAFGPAAAMMLLQLRTSTFSDGSRLQGRAFLGPSVPAADANGSPNAGIITPAVAFGVALLDEGVGDDNPALVVWRRPRAANPDATPPVDARAGSVGRVTSTGVPDRYAVLRSRRD